MDIIIMVVSLGILVSGLVGVIFLLYRAIRSFIAKKIWSGFGFILLSSVLILFILPMLSLPPHGHKEKAKRAICMGNLKQINLFLKMYANDHDNIYPATFNDLVGTNLVRSGDVGIFACPSLKRHTGSLTNIQDWADYAYVSGLKDSDPANCVVVFCSPENHRGDGTIVGFVDGHVQWFNSKSSAGQNTPTFQELTNSPALFYGTTNEVELADLRKRTRIIWPQHTK